MKRALAAGIFFHGLIFIIVTLLGTVTFFGMVQVDLVSILLFAFLLFGYGFVAMLFVGIACTYWYFSPKELSPSLKEGVKLGLVFIFLSIAGGVISLTEAQVFLEMPVDLYDNIIRRSFNTMTFISAGITLLATGLTGRYLQRV